MEDHELLKNEINRLNSIVTVLLDQISILKSENSRLKSIFKANNSNDTNADLVNGIKNSNNSIANFEDGSKNSIDSILNLKKGIKTSNDAIADFNIGTQQNYNTIDNFENGIKQNINANANIGSGIKTVLANTSKSAKHPIEIDITVIAKLSGELKKILPASMKTKSIFSIARELLLIHNNGSASYSELRKIAELSMPGFAKHAPKLKRRGLIFRQSHQKYLLTEFSKAIIAKTFPA